MISGLVALANVSFGVQPQSVLGIIGPNGAGKTTLLNVLSRFIDPVRGATLRFAGRDLLTERPHRLVHAGIGRTFQSVEICATDSVLENVMAGATTSYDANLGWCFLGDLYRDAQARELREVAFRHLEAFAIHAWADARAADVPYAVKKRLQICRALMARPKLLFLDEPASGISAAEKELLRQSLVDLRARTDLTIIIIEHDVGFLTRICTHMLALNFGRVIAQGTVAEVKGSPEVISAYLGKED